MIEIRRAPAEIVEAIRVWLRRKLDESPCSGAVVGLSGGLDSAVVSVLLRDVCGERMLAVKMPCHSLAEDSCHADLVIDAFGLPSVTVDLSEVYDTLVSVTGVDPHGLAGANVKPRLRMTTLYALAQSRNYLVCGTSNRAEFTVGYFTKHGDSGVDLLPLGALTKAEVRAVASYLAVPPLIIEKQPSAGLWEGQTDEEDMGLSYERIDGYILSEGQTGDDDVRRRYELNAHKRCFPEICDPFGGDMARGAIHQSTR